MNLTRRLETAVTQHGSSVILRSATARWTGAELDATTRAVAAGLRRHGVGTDDVVELHTDDHTEAIVLMVAVLRAGAAFCVVPPTYPEARVERIRERIKPAAVLTSVADGRALGGEATDELPERAPDALAYVIFTSGSTGDPKAVEITDGNLLFLADQPTLYPGEVIAHAAALQFDACIYEILGGLLNGMAVAVVDYDDLLDRHSVARSLAGVDILFVTTQVFNLIADRAPEAFDRLQLVLFGGERVSPRHVAQVAGRCRVVHVYGPTETTVYATWHEVTGVEAGADVPIGRALAGGCIHVLDEQGEPVPEGGTGELVVGGGGLMRGYRGQPEATAAATTTVHGATHYRTGDLVVLAADDVVTYVGRRDRQVKISGYRVDPAEVEDVALELLRAEGRSARAVAVPDQGKLRLFVTGCTDVRSLRAHLRQQLPRHLVPVVTPVGGIPLTPNLKTDVGRLLDLAHGMSPAQERAREVFAGLVDAEQARETATFIDLGGDSLAAMDAVWRLDEMGVVLDMTGLLTRPLEEVLRDVA
ncbi:MAG: hypothetical protein JWP82_63 [Humibacillus sp.]|nr:hypothetical protein [Humibacillus sp.]